MTARQKRQFNYNHNKKAPTQKKEREIIPHSFLFFCSYYHMCGRKTFGKVHKNGRFGNSHYIHISLVRKLKFTLYERSFISDAFTNIQQIKSIKKDRLWTVLFLK